MTTPAEAVAEGQAAAEALMTDACGITRGSGERVYNSETHQYETPSDSVYVGKCRVKPSALSGNTTAQAGDTDVSLWPFTVSIPVTADAELNDVVTITASSDPTLVDRKLRVRSVARGTHITARRLDCEEDSDG